ncbi:UDP-glucosyltransferase 2-like [Schistocerca americana]|uniref:UDP-glucosyltransferase 2-like n=1 Tax=Schistocerca americana TaxID=7009 RepID=UPI001F4F6A0C|nr:UDP-glucosyltransferase 2-like [Schistocerca americana]
MLRLVGCMLTLVAGASAAKILIIAPTPSFSHQLPFHILSKALLQRDHVITFITTDPMEIRHENFTQIDVSVSYIFNRKTYNFVKLYENPPTVSVQMLTETANAHSERQLSEAAVQQLIRSGEKFDLVVVERLGYFAYFGLVHKVGSPPLVGVLTLSPPLSVYHSHGNPVNPAYMPDMWLGFSDHMDFWQRLYNTYFYLRLMYQWFFEIAPMQEVIMRKYVGPDPPPVHETDKNFSLLLINNHFIMNYPRPHLPNIIELTGIHVATEQKPLPQEVQKFLDGAENGVIYFSLGSNVRSDQMAEDKQRAFIEAFRELPQRVLWKWESDSLPNQPTNLMVRKWLPQQDILAHPNVRVFIMQGGLQSLNEATYHAVPLLVMPFFSDQAHNAAKIKQAEIGIWLEYSEVSKETALRNLKSLLNDSKYRENMKRVSGIFREHKSDSVERAVWWIEYVMRHRGAPHLRSAALDLYWWQLLLLDVIGFIVLIAICASAVLCLLVWKLSALLTYSRAKIKAQ